MLRIWHILFILFIGISIITFLDVQAEDKCWQSFPEQASLIRQENFSEKEIQNKLQKLYDNYFQTCDPDSTDPTALNDQGVALGVLGKIEDAIRYYDKALLYFPEMNQALANKGTSLVELGKYKESIPYLEKALIYNPNEPIILTSLVDALFYTEKYEDALIYTDKILSVDRNNIEVLYRKAVILSSLDRFEESLTYFDKVMPFYQGDKNVQRGRDFVIQQIEENKNKDLQLIEKKDGIICGQGTILNDQGQCVPDPNYKKSSPVSGGCLIATATFGTEIAPQVQLLREIRDNTLLQTSSGISFMTSFNQFYYTFSPTIADWERQNPIFKETVKIGITPLLTSLSILKYVDIDSEAEVLGYGISLILLNIGMYFVAPTILVSKLKKRISISLHRE